MTHIFLDKAVIERDGSHTLDEASLSLSLGELVALVGPNGAGKTTLMRCALGALPLAKGAALIDGAPAHELPPLQRARMISYLPQVRDIAWPLIVRDIVALGRFAFGAPLSRLDAQAEAAVEQALAACGLSDLADRRADSLSGGEAARVHCARAFASEAPFLFTDEPTAALDPAGQFAIMGLIRRHVDQGGGALAILHDLNLAAAHADRLVFVKEGRILVDGPPHKVLSSSLIEETFGVTAGVDQNAHTPHIRITGLAGVLPK